MARGSAALREPLQKQKDVGFLLQGFAEPRLFHLIHGRRPSALRPRFVSLLDRNGPVASTTNQPQRADRKATP